MRSAYVLLATRMGSLHAFSQIQPSAAVRNWLGGKRPSADTIARVVNRVNSDEIRSVIRDTFRTLKKNKGFQPLEGGNHVLLVFDGHESHATYHRKCPGCLSRTIKTAAGERVQHYHRYVAAHLVGRDFCFMVDMESLRGKDCEIAAARRLYQRIHASYSRAYDIVLGDALYSCATFWTDVLKNNKHIITVLKDERRTLVSEARTLLRFLSPITESNKRHTREIRDLPENHGWSQLGRPVRIVQSNETKIVKRQLTAKDEAINSTWLWVTSIPPEEVNASNLVKIAHRRWSIENEGFNTLANSWHADHVYRHDATAIDNFILLTFLALNIFRVFLHRNIKPQRRARTATVRLAECIRAGVDANTVWHDTS